MSTATNGDHGKIDPPSNGLPVPPYRQLLKGNKQWAEKFKADPENAERIKAAAEGQAPTFLWIGCCDSRVPPTTITNKTIGDIFVARNIANIVRDPHDKTYNDASLWSAIEYSLDHFPLSTIVVCGHTDCGGARAAFTDLDQDPSASQNLKTYLAPLIATRRRHQKDFKSTDGITDPEELKKIERYNIALLAKFNVQEGVGILRKSAEVREKGTAVVGFMFDVRTLGLEVVPDSDDPRPW